MNAATNTAAVELNPTGTSIGTVTLTSPLADEFGGSNNQLVGKIYVVQTGQSSGQGSVTQPYLELWFPASGNPIYALGSFPSSLAFPLKLTFGEAYVSLLGKQEPLPLNSLEMNFPAATSPVKSNSCTTMGTAGGEVTDSIANLAYEFGDANDGVTSLSGTPGPVTLAATPTAVTDKCATNSATRQRLRPDERSSDRHAQGQGGHGIQDGHRRTARRPEVRQVEDPGQGSLGCQGQVGQDRRRQARDHPEEQPQVPHDQDQEGPDQ